MAEKSKPKTVAPAYWCTCVDDPNLCLGCAVDRLVNKILGDKGTNFLNVRVYKIVKQKEKY